MLFYIGGVCVFHAKNKCTMEGGKYVSHTSTFCRDTHENKCLDQILHNTEKTPKYPNVY